jgi:hypothetical protein
MRADARLLRWISFIFAGAAVLMMTSEASAHFLFIRIGPSAEAGRSAEVFFSEQALAGDPKFVPKIAHTKLWIQARPGEFRELDVRPAADRLVATLPTERSLSIVGRCEYGVLARPKETPFLLRYYPKAVAGSPDALNSFIPQPEIAFEIKAKFENGGNIRLSALRNGKPVPGAVFTIVDSSLSEQTVKADQDGGGDWKPTARGSYSIYTRETLKQPGHLGEQKYDEIREFATLALSWPLAGSELDPDAATLFNEAIAHRAEWRSFPGFSADVNGHLDGRSFTGNVTIRKDGNITIEIDDSRAKSWLQNQLESLVTHRLSQSGRDSTGTHQPKLRFADSDLEHPLGRLLAVEGDPMGSSYRIKDQQITVVNRRIGKQNMTITVIDNDKNSDGQFLPHSYVVNYWDAASGKLNRVETIQERFRRVGNWDLPVIRSIITSSDTGLSVRAVEFSEQKLLTQP